MSFDTTNNGLTRRTLFQGGAGLIGGVFCPAR